MRCTLLITTRSACREDPTVLDKYIDNHKHVPNLPDDVRERAKELLHSQPEFRVLARWTWLDRLTGPKVSIRLMQPVSRELPAGHWVSHAAC